MSMYFKQHGEYYRPDPDEPSRTKQSFKDSCDINKILAKHAKAGTLSHLEKHGAHYADYSDFEFDEHMRKIAQGREMFDELPSEVRAEFEQSPAKFFAFVNDPTNVDRLAELLPAIAKPGRYFPDPSPSTPPGATRDPDAPDPDVTPSTSEPSGEAT
jgi:hypothetical protein